MADYIGFENASNFSEKNPDPAFTKIVGARFKLWYQIEDPEGDPEVYIKATSSGDFIGEANFTESDTTMEIQNVYVEPEFKRQGVGTAMCVLAARILRKPLGIIWDPGEMTEEGQALWKHLVRQGYTINI